MRRSRTLSPLRIRWRFNESSISDGLGMRRTRSGIVDTAWKTVPFR